MTRYERKLFFERLMALREAYRADAHQATDLTIEDVATFAEQAYNDAVDADAAYAATLTETTTQPKGASTAH